MQLALRAALGFFTILATRSACAALPDAPRLPDSSIVDRVDFDRHVASLFGRLGCNAGSCHGSFQGRGGLNLSLFGHDSERDFATLTRGAQGRRVDLVNPDQSLVLLKPTGQVPHEGGQRFQIGSWEYRVIRAWIAEGARRDPARPAVERIEIQPGELSLGRPGGRGRFSVVARPGAAGGRAHRDSTR
jgi:hypothetical protein